MGINLQNNLTHQPGVELEVTVEEDDGEVYLMVLAEDPDGDPAWEYYVADPNEIVAFFAMVAEAKDRFERMK